MTSTSSSTNTTDTAIRQLPKDVVDRIAAGEVVARPANALKELLENSLDAGATKIMVQVDKSSSAKLLSFSISDNGHGIGAADLELAATRFATSKLTTVDDFQSLSSFGFRGEALASISMVSHLSITSRTNKSPMAFDCIYVDGKPQAKPKRCARTPGTTVQVKDLFYNLPHRKKALRDEYPKMLHMLQPYAVQMARKGVGIIVQQQGKKATIDLNTSNLSKLKALKSSKATDTDSPATFLTQAQQAATKQVIATIYGSFLEPHLLYFQSQSSPATGTTTDDKIMSYTCEGFLTAPSLASTPQTLQMKQAALLLFVNDRQVECPPLKRQLEEVYATRTTWKKPPLIYLSLQVPPSQVDVNVHPSKTQVALLFLEDVVAHITTQVQTVLAQQGQTFGEKQKTKVAVMENPYLKKKGKSEETQKRKRDDDNQASGRRRNSTSSAAASSSQLVRTHNATPVGALEPFLVKQVKNIGTPSTLSSTPSSDFSQSQSTAVTPASAQQQQSQVHQPPCPFATASPNNTPVDMSQPGAFAQMAQQCTCRQAERQQQMSSQSTISTQPRVARPAAVVPTETPLASIRSLRRRVQKRLDTQVHQKLRQAYFVGVVSNQRSVVQVGEELCLLHHSHLAQALFYQLALALFGGNRVASLDSPVKVQVVMEQVLQMEENIQDLKFGLAEETSQQEEDSVLAKVNETNEVLAKQATACLWERASMLQEYFGIRFEKQSSGEVVLTGLPILLDGHGPPPHGLPLFLLRLATEVEWEEEKPCFDGICHELGGYYAQLPSCDNLEGKEGKEMKALVQHTLFPALSCLLMPSHRLKDDLKPLTLLSNLYKVFERC